MSNGPNCSLYEFWGVELPEEPNGSNQYVVDCPFCDRPNHFYIDADTAQYQCKDANCGLEGNPYTFLKLLYAKAQETTVPFNCKKLSYFRKKFSPGAYEGEFAYDKFNGWFIFPDRNGKGTICNLGKYSGEGPVYGSPGCSQHFFGIDKVAESSGPIFLCEGRWDKLAFQYLLNHCKSAPEGSVAIGAPGASNVPKADLEYLTGRDIYLLYDNDDAGRNGAKIACKKLAGVAKSIHILAWPENRFPDKCDIEDLIRDSLDRPDALLKDIISWCFRFTKDTDISNVNQPLPQLVRNNFEEIIKDYSDTGIFMYPGLTDFLAVTLATVYSTKLQGEPLWFYGIGDPGRGKSLVLESSLGSHQCVYRTSVTHRAFISGFRDNGEDKSLLAILPGKAFIVKDYSNVLSLPHVEQEQIVSLLREAYDGRISRTFGNQLYREYPPPGSAHKDCRFAMVAGVTKEIHSKNHAGLGERFLKFEIPCTAEDNMQAMLAAIDDSWKSHELQLHRQAAVGAFLDRQIDFTKLPSIPTGFKKSIIGLSSFVGLSRSPVSRTRGDLDYNPSPESGTRVVKQLLKLSQSLCFAFNLTEANQEVYRLVRKVSWDTAHSWRRNLLLTLYNQDTPLNTHQVSDVSGFSLGTTHRQLHDMKALGVVSSTQAFNSMLWSLKDNAREIIEQGQLQGIINV